MLKKEQPPNPQIKMFVSMTEEINANRTDNKAHLYLVVQSEGKLPYFVFDVYLCNGNDVCYSHAATLKTEAEYVEFFR